MRRRFGSDEQWSTELVDRLPARWQRRLLGRWRGERNGDASNEAPAELRRDSNLSLLAIIERLDTVRLPLDATDEDVCERADEMARNCDQLAAVFHDLRTLRASMENLVRANGIEPWQGEADRIERKGDACAMPDVREQTDRAAVARMVDPLWWRRALRKLHAKAVEGAAIDLGYVHASKDIYVSDESLQRRTQQRARNQAMLEGTVARNEDGQEFTLAELAAKGTANRAIRRAELMTRIAGFERIARDLGHAGEFVTVTCPSRMHKFKRVGGRTVPNRKYDGTTPREAQSYLATVWARTRAYWKRKGLTVYGFRIAEPNHDGTPHWHLLVFCEPGRVGMVRHGLREQALADSGNEAGAQEHRCKFVSIDWNKGSAAGYIAKYVAKNIDGYRVERDLYGNDAMETSARVEAWAATWGIRQFQQVGGPPVGVWRELRRVPDVPAGAPEFLQDAHRAVNKTAAAEGEQKSVSWAAYCNAQGGIAACRKDLRIRLTLIEAGGVGRYGESLPPRPAGVECVNVETYRDGIVPDRRRAVHWFLESVRHAWEILSARRAHAARAARGAWTRVNNCTRSLSRESAAIAHGENLDEWISQYDKASGWAPA